MSRLVQPFNPLAFDPTQGSAGLPIGRHPVVIIAAEVKATQDNSGGFVELSLNIIDGPSKGATGAYRLNLYNQSQQAVEIAHKQLSAICYVTGVFQLGADGADLTALFNKPFVVDVGPQKKDPQYSEVKKVFDMNGNEPKPQGGGQPAQQQPAAGGWGGQGQAPQQQQPAQQGAAWGGQQQQPAQQQPQGGAPAWGGGQPVQQQAPGNAKPAWA